MKRVISVLLHNGSVAVKGRGFASDRTVGSVLQWAKIFAARSIDELVLLDVTAGKEGRGPNLDLVRAVADEVFVPLAAGGGIRSMQDADDLMRAGADKVVIGTWWQGIARLAEKYGSQAVVVAVDTRHDWCAHAECGKKIAEYSVLRYLDMIQHRGAGEILLQSIDRDGTRQGYDLELIRRVAAVAKVPVIASGGCSAPADMADAIEAGADAVAAGALWLFDDVTPADAKAVLRRRGVDVR